MRDMKDSGIEWIGKIPANKNIVRNKYYVSYTKGKNPISLNSEGFGKPYIGASDLDTLNNTYENYTTDEYIPECTKDDILVLWDGARAGLLGTNKIGCISSTIVKLEVIPEVIYTHFFFWYLKGFEKFLSDMVTGTTIPHMNRRYIEDIQFIDFSLHQQQAIADYLDGECAHIDGIVTTQRQIIERLKEYKKSVITEAVTRGLNPDAPMKDSSIDWIGKIPEHWEVRRIKTLGEYRNGLTYNPENMVDESNGTLVLRSSNIQNGKIVLDDNVFVNTIIPEQLLAHKGDIIICSRNGSRELVGKNALIKEDIMASFGAFMMIFRTNYPEYISYILNSAIFGYYLSTFFTATINQLTGSNFGNMQIVFCPDLNEQQEIIDYLDRECARIDAIIEKRERMIELMTEYKKSLIYECVTGKKEVA